MEHAVRLRELIESAELAVESIDAGLSRYVANWWRIDMAYRLCVRSLRAYGQVQLMAQDQPMGREGLPQQLPASACGSLERPGMPT